MGTTSTAMALIDHQLYYAHVGDSRLYMVRGSTIARLTHDHSYVSRLVENGVLRAEEAESHPQRHILTAALGAGVSITPDCPPEPVALESGDVLVLCTDGLWGLLTEAEIQSAVAGKTAAEICDTLVDTAKRRGGPDNITMQVLRLN
jgi:serine/threonine protein phosphatase PrpC